MLYKVLYKVVVHLLVTCHLGNIAVVRSDTTSTGTTLFVMYGDVVGIYMTNLNDSFVTLIANGSDTLCNNSNNVMSINCSQSNQVSNRLLRVRANVGKLKELFL